jgi:hypothetical protein
VGGSETEIRSDFEQQQADGILPASFRVVVPGQNPWWDLHIAWPPSVREHDHPVPDEHQVFIVNPLALGTWSPPAIYSLLLYALATSSSKGMRWLHWPMTRPTLHLQIAEEFSDIERAELLDVFEQAWGRTRVEAPLDIERLSVPFWSHLWWLGLVASVAVILGATSLQLPNWQRLIGISIALVPAFIARAKQQEFRRSAPRRKVARRASERGLSEKR